MKILVAGIPRTNQRISAIFADCNITFVNTLADATAALSARYDLVLIAVSFDESRMFELLRYAREIGLMRRAPVVCYRSKPGPVTSTPLARQAIELACRSVGADFFDQEAFSNAEAGNRAIREAVLKLVREKQRNE